jgi:hypothetical protein
MTRLMVILFFKKERFLGYEKVAQIHSKIYQERKSSDSSGGFNLGGTGKINIRDL